MASTKREKELARLRAERQAARRAAAVARRKQRRAVIASVLAVALIAAGAVALAATLSDDPKTDPAAAPSAQPSPSPSAGPPGTCTYTASQGPAARKVKLPPTTGVETKQPFTATITTNRGVIAFDLLTAQAPCTTNSLRSLAHFTYFDNTPCHRLVTAGIFVLQCGDPSGLGSGGPGYQFADENLEGATYPRGTVAMANAGAGTNGSQFFLVYKDSQLPPQYTPFGKITKGLEVLDAVAAGGSLPGQDGKPNDGKPKLGVTIKTLRTAAKR
ncbi:MAG TPA: peptidylprolyl isomerase [Mycobacteriales bacterium]|nr:peptidylprolyl isomerase [Mycobacteriales bacterium]